MTIVVTALLSAVVSAIVAFVYDPGSRLTEGCGNHWRRLRSSATARWCLVLGALLTEKEEWYASNRSVEAQEVFATQLGRTTVG